MRPKAPKPADPGSDSPRREPAAAVRGAASGAATACVQILCILLPWAGLCGGCRARDSRPNVLLLTVDTLRADHLEPYGYARPTSPEIARLAATAAVFEAAQAQASWTLPSLATLMTSLYPSTHGCWSYRTRVEPSFTTLAERLRNARYDTAAIVKHVFLGRPYGLHQGFTHFDDQLVVEQGQAGLHREVTSAQIADKATRWLELKAAAAEEVPWLLWAHFFDPHSDYVFHEGTSEPFAAAGEAASDRDRYDGEVAFTDRAVGRILNSLEDQGLADDTVVVLVSDHGEAFGEHGRTHHATTLYQELIHVPLIIRAPGCPPRRVATPVQVADVAPTVLELAGLAVPPGLAGRSLVPALRGAPLEDTPVVAEIIAPAYEVSTTVRALAGGPFPRGEAGEVEAGAPAPPPAPGDREGRAAGTLIRSVTLGRWKLVLQADGAAELFDLARDPGELWNLASKEPQRVAEMQRLLERTVSAAERLGADFARSPQMEHSLDKVQALEALGYAEAGSWEAGD